MRRTRLHLIHLLSAVVIAVLLGIHMVIQHLDMILGFFGVDVTGATSWSSMIGRSTRGVWAGLYIALLAFVLYHAMYGLRGIVLELTPSGKAEKAVTLGFIIGGIIIFIWASYVPLALYSN